MEQKAFEQANDFALEKECTLGSQVECAGIQWCPTMDIAAIALVESRVQLLRFSGQKLWTTASKGETVQVTALRWRPDGKVLCVGYDNGQVDLLDVETGATLYNMNVQDKDGQHTNESDTDNTPDTINESEPAEYFVTCLDWVTEEGAPTSIIEAGTASATALANQALSRGVGSHRGTEGGETLGTGCDCMCHIGPSYANGREEEGDHAEQFADLTSTCTRTLPPLFGISECCVKDVSMYTSTDRRPASAYLDVLVLGLNSGTVSFYAKGLLSLGSICVGGKGCVSGGIHSVRLGSDLSTLVATVAQTDKRHAREIFRQDSNASGTAEEALSSSSLYEANASVDAARTIEKRNTSTRTNSNDKTYTDIDTLTGTNDHTDMNTVIGAETGGGIGTHAGPNTSDVRGLDHNDTLDEALEMLTLVVVDVRAIGRRREALRTLAAAYSHCIALEDRAWGNFQSMEKSWEGLVHEFGQRLERYEQQQLGPTEDIGTQLLRLLTLGIAPDTLQHLLLHDLNEAETRKMAISMEQSYSAILRFAVNPMFGTSLAMLRQAVHLIGYARKRDHAYTRVGVSEVTCVAAVQAATGVCMKTSELIAVVHQARNQFKQFFMWLWVNILKLKEKTVPKNYLRHNTEQAVGQFLRSHIQTGRRRKTDNSICKDEIGDLKNSTSAGAGAKSGSGGGRSQFMEETVGQYFVNQPLTIPAGRSGPDAMRVGMFSCAYMHCCVCLSC
ncbi:hypothetical protein SARC_00332 [Sphaeroforma arctica JP610]|uniref:Anaphase-promoting complex subunit 4 n=1 Tax=Sphaeroforma arctica JP610 TaxID=667725 RepID=A0A0L0GF18_9EUKA|nr:hypothetical protein SARC_00332 [Sphaeroforma arctica JP610]KNC87567.1 hypothetical protein SARC_00332 [Sphaeroforma arctica JP610]|eukprot:XP_014161469.1 hypothetical protein SARC_00332 [Sphaeroforma arctica JP610]